MRQLQPILKPERVLGMLLDVTEVKVWEIHKEGELGVFEIQIFFKFYKEIFSLHSFSKLQAMETLSGQKSRSILCERPNWDRR